MALLSASGGVISTVVGLTGRLLSGVLQFFPLLSLVAPQLLSGLHVFWLIAAAMIVTKRGSATMTGALKGLVEVLLLSHIGVLAIVISSFEGLIVDLVLIILGRTSTVSLHLAGGLSSMSNVAIIQHLFLPQLPFPMYLSMYLASFISGASLGGYLANKTLTIFAYFDGRRVR